MRENEMQCDLCNVEIDKSACGQAFTIITIKDDRANDPKKFNVIRKYLCDDCTTDLELFLLKSKKEVK